MHRHDLKLAWLDGLLIEESDHSAGVFRMNGAYAGDMSPAEAWKLLRQDRRAVLVDVRTDPEWRYVGLPDLSEAEKEPALISWQVFPAMSVNEDFVASLAAAAPDREAPVLFLCRSGVRSRAAAIAATAAGYATAYNVAQGFEGDLDADGHRGRAGGWKAAGLPWRQS